MTDRGNGCSGCLMVIIIFLLFGILVSVLAIQAASCKGNEELVRKLNGTYHCAVVR